MNRYAVTVMTGSRYRDEHYDECWRAVRFLVLSIRADNPSLAQTQAGDVLGNFLNDWQVASILETDAPVNEVTVGFIQAGGTT